MSAANEIADLLELNERRRAKAKPWNPSVPTMPTLEVDVYGFPEPFIFGIVAKGDNVSTYVGEGFLLRFGIEKTKRGRRLTVAFHHAEDWPHYFFMFGVASAVAPDHVRFAMPLQSVKDVLGRSGGHVAFIHQVMPED